MRAKPVSEEPEVALVSWGIFVDVFGDPRLVGAPIGTTRGRISSAVQYFDAYTMTAVTASGRTYRLVGPADHMTAIAIVSAMRGLSHGLRQWMTTEDLALAVARPLPRGLH